MLLVSRTHKATVPRLAREYLRMTQQEMAAAIPMACPTLQCYEAGENRLGPEKERKLLRFLVEELGKVHEGISRPLRHVSLEDLRDDLVRALGIAYVETGERLVMEVKRRAAHRAAEVAEVASAFVENLHAPGE